MVGRKLAWLLVGLLYVTAMAGCSDLHRAAPAGFPAASSAPSTAQATDDSSRTPTKASRSSRKIIKNASVSVRVSRVESGFEEVKRSTISLGGFISSSNFSAGMDGEKLATLEAKVPSENLEQFLAQLSHVGKILSQSEKGEDVTEQFVDLEARLRNLRTEEERLLQIVHSAGGVKDLLEVEREITRVRGDIEQIEGHLKHMSYQVEYSTVAVTLNGLAVQTGLEDFWDLSGTVANAWLLFRLTIRFFLQTLIYMAMLLPFGLPVWWLHQRRSSRGDSSAAG